MKMCVLFFFVAFFQIRSGLRTRLKHLGKALYNNNGLNIKLTVLERRVRKQGGHT